MDRESQKAQDERVEKLWQTLDTRKEGQLSLNGLKKGLGILDHRNYRVTNTKALLILLQP